MSAPASSASLSSATLKDLTRAFRGKVGVPGSPIYERGRKVFSPLARTRRPSVVIRPADAREIAEIVAWANRTGTRLAIRSGGHSFDGFPIRDGAALLDLSELNVVEMTNDGRLHAAPGATNAIVANALHAVGRALPHGDCPTVALGGLVCGGGFGYATRRFGLALDCLVEATVVTADGRTFVANGTQNKDLFWACRGGAGTAGIVTHLILDTFPVDVVTAFTFAFKWEAAAEVLLLFDRIIRTSPGTLDLKFKVRTTGPDRFMDISSVGPDDVIPGTPLVHIDGQYLGARKEAESYLKPLIDHPAAAAPLIRQGSYYDAMLQLVPLDFLNDPAPPTLRPLRVASDFARGALTPPHADSMMRFIEELQTAPGLSGGAILIEPADLPLGKAEPHETAFPHRQANLILQYELFESLACDEALVARHSKMLGGLRESLAAVLTGGRYVNYADIGDSPAQWWGENLAQLTRVVDKHDPNRVLISRLHP